MAVISRTLLEPWVSENSLLETSTFNPCDDWIQFVFNLAIAWYFDPAVARAKDKLQRLLHGQATRHWKLISLVHRFATPHYMIIIHGGLAFRVTFQIKKRATHSLAYLAWGD